MEWSSKLLCFLIKLVCPAYNKDLLIHDIIHLVITSLKIKDLLPFNSKFNKNLD